MFKPNNTTTDKTVKIFAPFPSECRTTPGHRERQSSLNVAAPAGRQQGDYLYSATVTLLREDAARVYDCARLGKCGDRMRRTPTRRSARMRDHELPLEIFNHSKQGV